MVVEYLKWKSCTPSGPVEGLPNFYMTTKNLHPDVPTKSGSSVKKRYFWKTNHVFCLASTSEGAFHAKTLRAQSCTEKGIHN